LYQLGRNVVENISGNAPNRIIIIAGEARQRRFGKAASETRCQPEGAKVQCHAYESAPDPLGAQGIQPSQAGENAPQIEENRAE
jgi:hypothetical protein